MNEIDKALKTWYAKDHLLHLDPLHPAIKLAGEAGELLDLYGKEKFKPGFSWWDCKNCGYDDSFHNIPDADCENHTPLVLDELGDWWYYCRILIYLSERNINDFSCEFYTKDDELFYLNWMNYYSAMTLRFWMSDNHLDIEYVHSAYKHFVNLLNRLDITLDYLTELNYKKLNSEPTNHGWKGA